MLHVKQAFLAPVPVDLSLILRQCLLDEAPQLLKVEGSTQPLLVHPSVRPRGLHTTDFGDLKML